MLFTLAFNFFFQYYFYFRDLIYNYFKFNVFIGYNNPKKIQITFNYLSIF